jgi:hypothetical protein
MYRVVIGLSGFAGSGKSAVSDYLVNQRGFVRIKFAGPLKDMLRTLGLTEDEIEGHLKKSPCELLGGKTPRHAMITLGTEWGGVLIHPDLWARAWRLACSKVPAGKNIVVDDLRFPNEQNAVHAEGGMSILIERPGTEPAAFKWFGLGRLLYRWFGVMWGVHDSERIDRLSPKARVKNDAAIEDLIQEVDFLIMSSQLAA